MDIDANIIIETIRRQRNEALDAVAVLNARLAALMAEEKANAADGPSIQQTAAGEY
jgi:hypothetical protein